ncbi:MAG: FAD-binding oxidoreductase [Proteobacteria bacterium]|nr:FAD-binding oxidoreductase [Pseudomonadota bacterium]MBI3499134.1 FAD-binding oxidoreductase [Pseudomonadota bacterium]
MATAIRNRASPDPSTLERIRRAVGDKACLVGADEIEPYLTDWRGLWHGRTSMVVRPGTVAEVAEVMRIAAETGTPVVPQGGNTGMCGGATPYEDGAAIVLSLGRLNRVRAIDPLNYTITVEAGCVLADIQRRAADADRFFPLSLGAEGSCQIGGNLSTNAGGTAVLRYGNARELVLGLEVVLPDGSIWDGLRSLRKDNTGFDLKQLFVGAEGTLGIITAAVLKLFPKPRDRRTAFVALRDVEAAIELLARTRAATGDQVTTFELVSWPVLELVLKHIPGTVNPLSRRYGHYALVEITSTADHDIGLGDALEEMLGQAAEDGLVLDATIAQSEAQSAAFWKLRETAAEAQKAEGASIKHDVSVPVARVPAFMQEAHARVLKLEPKARLVAFGHVGDGNIHFNVAEPVGGDAKAFLARWAEFNRVVHDCVVEFGGSISAEHGIGRLKREELQHYKSATELDLMRRIKAALDPKGIMNPGKVL